MFGTNRFTLTRIVKYFVLRRPHLARLYWNLKGINSFSRGGFDSTLESSFQKIQKGGFFVDVGANDGLYESNTYKFELFHNFKGILIEPEPNMFRICRKSRSRKNHFIEAACVPFGYLNKTTPLIQAGAMSVSWDLESDLHDKISHVSIAAGHLSKYSVKDFFGKYGKTEALNWHFPAARTLNSILEEFQAPNYIDILSIDVEGSESAVIKGVNHSQYRFGNIIIESRDLGRTKSLLEGFGYYLVAELSPTDFLFRAREVNQIY